MHTHTCCHTTVHMAQLAAVHHPGCMTRADIYSESKGVGRSKFLGQG
jgi:hypothetical protein